MDKKELEIWIETEEGKEWAESLKRPLVTKRDELLGGLKKHSVLLAEMEQRRHRREKFVQGVLRVIGYRG
jgi:hypothetical protein